MRAKITFLGTNTFPVTRESTNFLIEMDSFNMLVECCGSVTLRMQALKKKLESVNDLFLSHIHGDHTLGVPLFFHAHWLARMLRPGDTSLSNEIRVFAPSGVFEKVYEISRTLFPTQMTALERMVRIVNIKIDQTREYEPVKKVKLKFFGLDHSVPTYGFRLDALSPKISIAYVPDTLPIPRITGIIEGVDVLIHDAFCIDEMREIAYRAKHSTVRDAARVAEEAGVKILLLVHMLQTMHGREEQMIKEAKAVFSGEVILPRDLESIEI